MRSWDNINYRAQRAQAGIKWTLLQLPGLGVEGLVRRRLSQRQVGANGRRERRCFGSPQHRAKGSPGAVLSAVGRRRCSPPRSSPGARRPRRGWGHFEEADRCLPLCIRGSARRSQRSMPDVVRHLTEFVKGHGLRLASAGTSPISGGERHGGQSYNLALHFCTHLDSGTTSGARQEHWRPALVVA